MIAPKRHENSGGTFVAQIRTAHHGASPNLLDRPLLTDASWQVVTASAEFVQKLDEIEHLLNDPDTPLDAEKVWALLADVRRYGEKIDDTKRGER